jgi:ubiquitin-protein ligase
MPMIPIRMPKKRYSEPPEEVMLPEFIEAPKDDKPLSKECAICRRGNTDFEHSCGVAFHKACVLEYFDAISAVDGAERICPHCYAPFPLDLESEEGGFVEVSPIPDEIYDQYLQLSDEFSLALIDSRITDVSVLLTSPSEEQFFVNVYFRYYPKKPTFSFSDELLHRIDSLEELLEELNSWDSDFPPNLVDVFLNMEKRIRPREEEIREEETELPVDENIEVETGFPADEIKEEGAAEGFVGEVKEETAQKEGSEEEVVEVFPEGIVEVTPEDAGREEEYVEAEEALPATFFELDYIEEGAEPRKSRAQDSFENEEAIKQYLKLSNSYSVELIDDNIYHAQVHLSSLDAGIYNIYPVTINFKNYPEKPTLIFTDDLLIRIRGPMDVLDSLNRWKAADPMDIMEIFQTLEMRLAEDSLIESELEVIRREFSMRRPSKNKILVTVPSYGPKLFDCELDLSGYPAPPIISLPEELAEINIDELEGIRKWPEKLQKKIMDVLRSLSLAIKDIFRMEFEEMLLSTIVDEFQAKENGYDVAMVIPRNEDNSWSEEEERGEFLFLEIRLSDVYPLMHPEIEVYCNDEALKMDAQILMDNILKSWAPTIFLADVVNRLSLSLWNTSKFKCLICKSEVCPTCGLPLLTSLQEDLSEICEVPCIQCKRPYHVHCVTQSIEEGMSECGYCLTDLSRLFMGRD